MRIAFDLDETLVPVGESFPVEEPPYLTGWLTRERLRADAPTLLQALAVAGHEIWIYTTSLRAPFEIRLLFWVYRLRAPTVINAVRWQLNSVFCGPGSTSMCPTVAGRAII